MGNKPIITSMQLSFLESSKFLSFYAWLGAFQFPRITSPRAETHPTLLAALLKNLLDSLREDGFSRVFTLTPPSLSLGLGSEQIRLPANLLYSIQPPESSLSKVTLAVQRVILIPIGHTEQYAFHLPLFHRYFDH